MVPELKTRTFPIAAIVEKYLIFGEYAGIIPFPVASITEGRRVSCYFSVFKVFLLALHGFSLILVLFDFFFTIVETYSFADIPAENQLATVIPIITYFMWIVDVMLFKFIVFTKVSSFRKLLKNVRATETLLEDGRKNKSSVLHYLPLVFVAVTIVSAIEENFLVYLKLHIRGLNDTLFETILRMNTVSDLIYHQYINGSQEQPLWAQAVAIGIVGANSYEAFAAYFSQTLCLALAIQFWLLARSSAKQIKALSCVQKKLHISRNLQRLSKSVNDTLGGIILIVCFGTLPFYCFKIRDAVQGSWAVKVQLALNLLVLYTFLMFSAEIHAMMKPDLLRTQNSKISVFVKRGDYLTKCKWSEITMYQMKGDNIGMKGRTFTVTYTVMGAISASLIAYSAILIDMGRSKC